jgi:GNAT superfamily N-acetyltransferase
MRDVNAENQSRCTVRDLITADLSQLLALYTDIGLMDGGTVEHLERTWSRILSTDLLLYLGVFVDGVLASTCHAVIVPNLTRGGRPYAIIENVGTLQTHRRQGLGALAMRTIIARCWEAGCYKIMLASGTQRAAAHAFYDSLGFDRNAKQSFILKPPARQPAR